jgi:hypothetical protein
MRLRPGGIDVFYIDESNDAQLYVMTAVAVPFIRSIDKTWHIVWPDYLDAAKDWRRTVGRKLHIPTSKELHGLKLASGRGNYYKGKYPFDRPRAGAVYRQILALADFLPSESIITISAKRSGRPLFGLSRLEAALHALFQRMRRQCDDRNVNAIVFFDGGHAEYRKLYRKAQVYLLTGSNVPGIPPTNLPLDMFTKDGNNKDSKFCHFTQLADMIAYAAFLKMKGESMAMTDWQERYSLDNLYGSVPYALINHKASRRWPDGIVRLP